MKHFGDPCIHCNTPHDQVSIGPCEGDKTKAIPISYRSIAVRHDGVEHFKIRMSNGEIKELYSHISNHSAHYHFGHSKTLTHPPDYDPSL